MDRLSMRLSDTEATKLQCTIDCTNGMKKTYWINCNVQPDIQHLNLDKGKFPSYFVVKPRDFNRLLSNFQASLQEITVIATENLPMTSSTADAVGGKAVELRSYTDPTKENNDASLHTQLWIDPAEEFLQYTHRGDPVDVTFSMKELKAFLSFCEACEVDTQLCFERAGEPILLAPKFGLEDTPTADFDATLVLATMLLSQLREGNVSEGSPAAPVASGKQDHGNPHEHVPCHASAGEASRRMVVSPNNSQNPSNHTRIWSELSGSAANSFSGEEERVAPLVRNSSSQQDAGRLQRHDKEDYLEPQLIGENQPALHSTSMIHHPVETKDMAEANGNYLSQRHPSNWIDSVDDEDDDEGEMYVQSTP
ncbi:uncharacterized protein LOC116262935 isoform X2 [Nymphaea colorata]|nr:uncharacterized protein LOC116262935 isoform X2 [Nymphaea colorata]